MGSERTYGGYTLDVVEGFMAHARTGYGAALKDAIARIRELEASLAEQSSKAKAFDLLIEAMKLGIEAHERQIDKGNPVAGALLERISHCRELEAVAPFAAEVLNKETSHG